MKSSDEMAIAMPCPSFDLPDPQIPFLLNSHIYSSSRSPGKILSDLYRNNAHSLAVNLYTPFTMTPQLHQRPPFRAEHLGSLLRPDQLLETKFAFEAGKIPESQLTASEDKEINAIVETQKKIGYAAMSDGEYRRHSKRSREPLNEPR
mgnify:CR=1 FL=1